MIKTEYKACYYGGRMLAETRCPVFFFAFLALQSLSRTRSCLRQRIAAAGLLGIFKEFFHRIGTHGGATFLGCFCT